MVTINIYSLWLYPSKHFWLCVIIGKSFVNSTLVYNLSPIGIEQFFLYFWCGAEIKMVKMLYFLERFSLSSSFQNFTVNVLKQLAAIQNLLCF